MGFGVSIATVGSLVASRRVVGRTKNLRSEGVVLAALTTTHRAAVPRPLTFKRAPA